MLTKYYKSYVLYTYTSQFFKANRLIRIIFSENLPEKQVQ